MRIKHAFIWMAIYKVLHVTVSMIYRVVRWVQPLHLNLFFNVALDHAFGSKVVFFHHNLVVFDKGVWLELKWVSLQYKLAGDVPEQTVYEAETWQDGQYSVYRTKCHRKPHLLSLQYQLSKFTGPTRRRIRQSEIEISCAIGISGGFADLKLHEKFAHNILSSG